MNDSSRLIRQVYRFNPNDGLYDAIMEGSHIGMQLVEQPISPHEIKQMRGRAERVSPPNFLQESCNDKCATCFTTITKGIFEDGKTSRLFFCQKCGCQDQPYNWMKSLVVLGLTHLLWAAVFLLR